LILHSKGNERDKQYNLSDLNGTASINTHTVSKSVLILFRSIPTFFDCLH